MKNINKIYFIYRIKSSIIHTGSNDNIEEKRRRIPMNKDLTVGEPQSVLWKFSIPMFVSVIFQQLYNMADSVIAGKFAG